MDDFVLARVLHVLGVVLWIGGVAMVTSTLLPVIARMPPVFDRMDIFTVLRNVLHVRHGSPRCWSG